MSINSQLRSWYVADRSRHDSTPFVVVLIDTHTESWPPHVVMAAATRVEGLRALDAQPDPGRDRWYALVGPNDRGEIVIIDSEIEELKRRSGTVSGARIGATTDDQAGLYKETNDRFWARMHLAPGYKLNMANPKDREMSKVWHQIFNEVRGHRTAATDIARRAFDETGTPYVLVIEPHNGAVTQQAFPHRNNLDVQFNWLVDQPDYYRYVAAFDLTKDRRGPFGERFSSLVTQPADVAGWYGDRDRIGADAPGTGTSATSSLIQGLVVGAAVLLGLKVMDRIVSSGLDSRHCRRYAYTHGKSRDGRAGWIRKER